MRCIPFHCMCLSLTPSAVRTCVRAPRLSPILDYLLNHREVFKSMYPPDVWLIQIDCQDLDCAPLFCVTSLMHALHGVPGSSKAMLHLKWRPCIIQ